MTPRAAPKFAPNPNPITAILPGLEKGLTLLRLRLFSRRQRHLLLTGPFANTCPGGGIGRRAGFRCQWPQGRGSSSLLLGTIFTIKALCPIGKIKPPRTLKMSEIMAVYIYNDDLPDTLALGDVVAIDTETMGLNPHRDRLCLIQLSSGDGDAHLVKIASPMAPCPQLKAMLGNDKITKLFHFARFDVAVLEHNIGPIMGTIYCTKIASKLVRTYTDRHGLKDLCRELLQVDISKQQQSSDWGATDLTAEQADYAAGDVLYLHQLRARLDMMLAREHRQHVAAACFDFIRTRTALDLGGFADIDIFHH